MNQQDDKKNFFDSRTILAVVLVGGLFFGWQKYLEHKYPDFYKNRANVTKTQTSPATPSTSTGPVAPEAANAPAAASAVEATTPVQFGPMNFQVSSKGMGFKQLTLSNYTDREHKPVQIGVSAEHGLFELGLLDSSEILNFQVAKVSENEVKGIAAIGSMQVEQTVTYLPDTGAMKAAIVVTGASAGFKGLTLLIPEHKAEQKDGTFFLPSVEHQEFAVRHQGSLDRVSAASKKEPVQKSFDQVGMVALGSQYFASAFLDKSEIAPDVQVNAPVTGELSARISYRTPTLKDRMEFQWVGYAGPKSVSILEKIDPTLTDVVDYGFFAPIGKVLLVVLKACHELIGNWGLSIILLTLLVRLLVLPFNITSYKSMKRMQAIQPMLASLRERYKDDPTALNRETMALMREQKVNPLGGCLPMLLQMPVFFALYRVLGQSIELYQAPFFGWITDLSLKDPFFILPVLMGVTMFIQQKITPSTMDPAQARILQFMPLIFSVFTLSLPAGLTLYIFVSTLFGVIQQQLFMRDRKASLQTAAVSAK